ncbi:AraC family transcriptional regulator [Paenilisteria rocourtiae]|uniref:AraC family transcriptional regulator n=1 Tax=Listeria rocourtiae TaxID=647910 RepID=A0A4R6ZHB8_9LIST|nr:AraC family transcriptional regulator [Listeria rocourtiae]EUJ47426.1 transcription activator effector binding protein [Listeria rocourtiae FSL F6-920]MBC1435386.1 AraC family transcriptional regulator [Listeria rocourtiae]TDR51535.1 AraC family transcriptional regulator [Listeria rocourtiae]
MDTIKQMNLAMQYIEAHLMDELDYLELSKIACCSEYHFRRVFSYLAGMPLSEYIRLRKLAVAAILLRDSDEKIIDIAIRFGYESPDAFTRAFQSLHHVTPTQARKDTVQLKAFLPMTFQLKVQGGNLMDYRIETKEAFKIVGISKRIKLVYEGVNPQMDDMWARLKPEDFVALKKLSNIQPSGIICASTNFGEGRQEGAELDQYIGVATTVDNIPARWETLNVLPSNWAVFTVCGEFPQALQDVWARIYSEWLPTSGYEVVPGPEILWNESPDTSKPDYKSEIWIPVIRK